MTKDEIVTSLRACANMDFSDCDKCACKGKGVFDNPFTCVDNLRILAADLIENQQREIEALRQANSALRERHMRLADLESICSYARLRELAEADREGRVEVLPCKVGDTVWFNGKKAIVTQFFGYCKEEYLRAQYYDDDDLEYIDIPFDEFCKTVFLTREEAEEALRRG